MNGLKKIFFFAVFSFLFCGFSQNAEPLGNLFFIADVNFQMNLDGKTSKQDGKSGFSAPSPVFFSIGAGWNFPIVEKLTISPSLSFSSGYWLWAQGRAFPAEIENRTAFSFSFFVDAPALYFWRFNSFFLSAGGGLAANFRIVARARGVSDSEGGSDTKSIRRDLWKLGNIFYPAIHANFDYVTSSGYSAGLGARFYLSLSGFKSGHRFFDSSIFAVVFRFTLPQFGSERRYKTRQN